MIVEERAGLRLFIPGQPVAKGRPKMSVRNGFARAYTPAKTVAYEGLIALAGQQAMDGREPFDCPVAITVKAVFQIPTSWSKRKHADAVAGLVWHSGRPDADNVMKALGDGLNGIVWRDDSLIASCHFTKLYGATPGLDVWVEALPS